MKVVNNKNKNELIYLLTYSAYTWVSRSVAFQFPRLVGLPALPLSDNFGIEYPIGYLIGYSSTGSKIPEVA